MLRIKSLLLAPIQLILFKSLNLIGAVLTLVNLVKVVEVKVLVVVEISDMILDSTFMDFNWVSINYITYYIYILIIINK